MLFCFVFDFLGFRSSGFWRNVLSIFTADRYQTCLTLIHFTKISKKVEYAQANDIFLIFMRKIRLSRGGYPPNLETGNAQRCLANGRVTKIIKL